MVKKLLLLCLLSLIPQKANSSIWDTLFPPSPYSSEEEAIEDAKNILKYTSQCQYVSCKSTAPRGVPSDNIIRSCELMSINSEKFYKKYSVSPGSVKTPHVQWYLDKISDTNDAICD